MNRRYFLQLAAVALAGTQTLPLFGQSTTTTATDSAREELEGYFGQIVEGFLRNARATSPELVVCDFPEGTKLKGCCTPSGKTYVSVA
ncbi:MAG: hypothetical protein ABIP55_02030, partial [Tepidisphaeraceae bacterium]